MNSNDKVLAVMTHVLGIFTGFIGPLVVFLVTKSKPVKRHARNALNWQLSRLIYTLVSVVLVLVLVGFVFLMILSLVNLVFCIIAAVRAGNGEEWEYPLSIRFLKA
ncbi:DUF4870 domain-containing protein [Candidatus Woesearchaeota archaeon]|nr:DUF4870 domain-containing protein [Candidatus Woesearchaeota archaeon]